MVKDLDIQVFFELLRAGLWGGQRPVQEFKSSRLWGRGVSVSHHFSVRSFKI